MTETNLYAQSKLIIFDLDGTLYEDTDHFSYYAKLLKREISESDSDAFDVEYKKMIDGDHILTIGRVYDVVRDHVLEVDSSSMTVTKAWTWDGEEISRDERMRIYHSPITFDFESMIAIGDGWWLPNACAKHFGAVNTYSAYEKTKEYMASDQFTLTKIPGLREGLLNIKDKRNIVLVTNSQPDDVARLLNQLDLEDIFEDIVTEAKKPQMTKHIFSDLLTKYGVDPSDVVSVGDNFINEIAPAINLGINTIFIDFYGKSYPEYKGVKVGSISDTLEDMNAF